MEAMRVSIVIYLRVTGTHRTQLNVFKVVDNCDEFLGASKTNTRLSTSPDSEQQRGSEIQSKEEMGIDRPRRTR